MLGGVTAIDAISRGEVTPKSSILNTLQIKPFILNTLQPRSKPKPFGLNTLTKTGRGEGSRTDHLVFERVSQKFGVRVEIECLHHPVFVESNRTRFDVNNARHLLHRQSLGEQL